LLILDHCLQEFEIKLTAIALDPSDQIREHPLRARLTFRRRHRKLTNDCLDHWQLYNVVALPESDLAVCFVNDEAFDPLLVGVVPPLAGTALGITGSPLDKAMLGGRLAVADLVARGL
jgi:hypothetical protein